MYEPHRDSLGFTNDVIWSKSARINYLACVSVLCSELLGQYTLIGCWKAYMGSV